MKKRMSAFLDMAHAEGIKLEVKMTHPQRWLGTPDCPTCLRRALDEPGRGYGRYRN